jgi:hypothetical protein
MTWRNQSRARAAVKRDLRDPDGSKGVGSLAVGLDGHYAALPHGEYVVVAVVGGCDSVGVDSGGVRQDQDLVAARPHLFEPGGQPVFGLPTQRGR